MARVVRWTLSAAANLQDACEFVEKDSPAYASALAARVIAAAESLEEMANRGRVVPEVDRDDIREVFVHRYRLIYRVQPNVVHILALIHGARLLSVESVLKAEEE